MNTSGDNENDSNTNGSSSLFEAAFSKLKESDLYQDNASDVKQTREQESLQPKLHGKHVSKNCVLINPRQRGNPIIKSIRNVPFEYAEVVPDYVMGATTCALFLSLRYHTLNPKYIHERLRCLGQQYQLRVLLVQVDVKEPHHELKQLTKICVLADLTLILAWSPDEAGRIIEVYKIFEHKPPDLIMEKQETNPHLMMVDALTSIKSVNRTDAMTLLSNFGSLEKIIVASEADLSLCPGLGPQKAARLYSVLHQPFKKLDTVTKKTAPSKGGMPKGAKWAKYNEGKCLRNDEAKISEKRDCD